MNITPAELRRFRRDHVKEAFLETRSIRNALKEEKLEEERAANPNLFVKGPRQHRPFKFHPGAHLGTFELVEVVGRAKDGSKFWRVRCGCGKEEVRKGTQLAQSARDGHEPTCRTCRSSRASAFRDFARDAYADAFRRQWVDYQTLWTIGQTRALMADTRRDLEDAFGEVESEAPSLRWGHLEIAAGFYQEPRGEDDTSPPGRLPFIFSEGSEVSTVGQQIDAAIEAARVHAREMEEARRAALESDIRNRYDEADLCLCPKCKRVSPDTARSCPYCLIEFEDL